jgi:hypothetical protein
LDGVIGGAHAKAQGRVGVDLGGALQILFGIIGGRWQNSAAFKPFFNDNWCRPSAEETPRTTSAWRTAPIGEFVPTGATLCPAVACAPFRTAAR